MLDIRRSTHYYRKKHTDEIDVIILNEIRDVYTQYSFFGYRKIHAFLRDKGFNHNIKKTQRLMQYAGIKAVYQTKRTTIPNKKHKKYPYLLKGLKIEYPNQVWQTDITYIKIRFGFVYLVCMIDIFSRKIMGWNLSTFLDTESCITAYEMACNEAIPEILNSDQGCQFTSDAWTERLSMDNVLVSMNGKGRWVDNVYIERLWRTIKYESIYLNSFDTVTEIQNALEKYIRFYNTKRPHQSLNYKTPQWIYQHFYDIMLHRRTFIGRYSNCLRYELPIVDSQIGAKFLS